MGKTAPTAKKVTDVLLQLWEYSIPKKFYTDGGPQFASKETAEFLARWKVTHIMSSPHHPQSNGIAEEAVKEAKKLINANMNNSSFDQEGLSAGLAVHRNTKKKETNLSPAEWVFGKPMRDTIPISDEELRRSWKKTIREKEYLSKVKKRAEFMIRQKKANNKIEPGRSVVVQNPVTKKWTIYGEVVSTGINQYEFMIKTEAGQMLRRNQKFIRPIEIRPRKLDSKPRAQDPFADMATKRNTRLNKAAGLPLPQEGKSDEVSMRPKRERKTPVRFLD